MEEMVLGIDVGTGSCRAAVVDRRGRIRGVESVPLRRSPSPAGWIDLDALAVWRALRRSVRRVLTRGIPGRVVALGIACQRSTTVVWERRTQRPLAPAISWQCLRTRSWMRDRISGSDRRGLERRSGLPAEPYYAASKMAFAVEQLPRRVRESVGDALAVGTLDSFLISQLGEGREPVTDLTQASRTLLVDLGERDWSATALRQFGLQRDWLPRIVPTIGELGRLRRRALDPLPAGLPIVAAGGDQQAALFGSGQRKRGEGKITYGSGAFLLAPTGPRKPAAGEADVIRSVAWCDARRTEYLTEVNLPSSGTVIDWLRRLTGTEYSELLRADSRRGNLAERLGDLVFVPSFAGLGTVARGLHRGRIDGLHHDCDGPRLASALAAGIGASLARGLEKLENRTKTKIRRLLVDGGGSRDSCFLQVQATLLQRRLHVCAHPEATAFGAAALAWQALDGHAPALRARPTPIAPALSRAQSGRIRERFDRALASMLASPELK